MKNNTIIYSVIKEIIYKTGGFKIQIDGDSMNPVLRNGQIVYIAPINQELREGDIILFYRKNILVLHRIIKKYSKRYLLKGDNENEIDMITSDKIIGLYVNNDYTISNLSCEINKVVGDKVVKIIMLDGVLLGYKITGEHIEKGNVQ